MNKLKERWASMLWYDKASFIIGMLCSISIIALACLQLFNVWEDAIRAYMPLTAVLMLVQAFENRKRSRGLVILSLCVAVFIAIVWVLVLLGL